MTPPARAQSGKRPRLIRAAVELVHEQGFHRTTLADIARRADVPLGRVYYYFKTKEEIGQAVIADQAEHHERLRQEWETSPDPVERLDSFIAMTLDNREALVRSGCPVGTLCDELGKAAKGARSGPTPGSAAGGTLAEQAGGLLGASLDWLEQQFRALGTGEQSAAHAVHLLSALQGATLLTHAFGSTRYLEGEAERLRQWLRTL